MQNTLITGKPTSVITKLWGSVMIGSALMQIYNAANGIITGHCLGVDALGGIGAAGTISSLMYSVFYNLMRGFTIPMSKAYGAGDFPRVRQLLWPGLLLGLILTTVTTLVLLPLVDGILILMQTPDENFIHASRHLFAAFLAMLPCTLFNTTFFLCHVTGNGKLASLGQIIVAFITLLFDVLFLIVWKFGAEGPAYSSLIGNSVGSISIFWILLRKNPQLLPQKGDIRIRLSTCKILFGNGVSSATSGLLMQLASTVLQAAVNSMGAVYVNANAIANKLFNILAFPMGSLDYAMHDYLCHNAGALRWDRIRKGYRSGWYIVFVCSSFYLLIGTLFTQQLVSLIVGIPTPELVELVRLFMIIVGVSMVLYGASLVYRHTPVALGHPGSMALTGGLEGAGRLIACVILYRFGFIGACLILPLGWFTRDIYDVIASYFYLHKLEKDNTQ